MSGSSLTVVAYLDDVGRGESARPVAANLGNDAAVDQVDACDLDPRIMSPPLNPLASPEHVGTDGDYVFAHAASCSERRHVEHVGAVSEFGIHSAPS